MDEDIKTDQHADPAGSRTQRHRRLLATVVELAVVVAFTWYLIGQSTAATGPAIDFAFDFLVWVALMIHLTRRWLGRHTPRP